MIQVANENKRNSKKSRRLLNRATNSIDEELRGVSGSERSFCQ